MGLLELDLPPIDLHASTQCDIRTPEKARFLADAGFSQLVLARELTLDGNRRRARRACRPTPSSNTSSTARCAWPSPASATSATRRPGAAPTAATARRPAACPTRCRTAQGRVVAFEKHLLSVKDNNQSANLRALIDAGVHELQDRGPLQGSGLRQEHHRPLPPAARRDPRTSARSSPPPRAAARNCCSRPIRTRPSIAARPTTSPTAARPTSAPSTRRPSSACRSAR